MSFYVLINLGHAFALFLSAFIVDLEYSMFIVNVIKCYLMVYLCRTLNRRYIYWSSCKAVVYNCVTDQPYGMFFRDICLHNLSDDIIFDVYYFIAVPIGKTCSISLVKFNNCIFYILVYFISDFEQVFHNCSKFLYLSWKQLLTIIVNEAYTFFIL